MNWKRSWVMLLLLAGLLAGCGEQKVYKTKAPDEREEKEGQGGDVGGGGGEVGAMWDSGARDPGGSDSGGGSVGHDYPPFCEELEGPLLGKTRMGSFFRGDLVRTSGGDYEGGVIVEPEVSVGYIGVFVLKVAPPHQASEIAIYDLNECVPIRADSLGRVFHRVTYTRAAGDKPGIYLRAKSSDGGARVPFELKVVPVQDFEAFCQLSDFELIEPGQVVEGQLDPSVDPADGPEGYALKSYRVDLERGQRLHVDFEHLSGVPVQAYVFDSVCGQEYPSQAYNRETQKYEADEPFFTARQTSTYRVLINAKEPGEAAYRFALEIQ